MKLPVVTHRIIEVMPLAIFLFYAETIDHRHPENWLEPYVFSSIAAAFSTALFFFLKKPLNPLFIGINLYLISGSIGLIANLTWLNSLYGDLQAAGMLAWIILIGLYCFGSRSLNFLAAQTFNKQSLFNYSAALLSISIAAFLMSYFFQPNKLLSEYAPFIILFSAQAYFRKKVTPPSL